MAINKVIYDVSGEQIVDTNGQVTVYGIDGHGHTVNKVEYGQSVLIDITDTTATASDVALNETFYTADGIKRTGTKSNASPIDVDNSTGTVSNETLVISSGGGSGTTRIIELYDNTATITSDPDVNYIWINNQPEDISVGDTYRVTWNGTAYTTTAVSDSILSSQYGNTFGNPGILNGTDDGSNAPFCAFKASWSDNEMIVSTSASPGDITLKIEKIIQGGGSANLGTKTITANGTYNANNDSLDGYSQVTVNVSSQSPSLQSKTVTPTTSSQSVTADNGYDGLDTVTVNAIPSSYIVPTGSQTITTNNTYDVTNLAQVVVNVQGSSKNVQIANGINRVNTTEYTAVSGQTLTVAETGKYDVYWSGYRSSTSGTSGSQLYIDDSAYGSANTTFSNNGQSVHLSNVSLTKNQVIEVRARARNTSYYMYVSNLTIIQS